MRNRWAWVVLAMGVSIGCSRDRAAKGQSEIVRGEPDTKENDAVVLLTTPSTSCTATVVAPNLVLTARNCLGEIDGRFACNARRGDAGPPHVVREDDPRSISIWVGLDAIAHVDKRPADALGLEIIAGDGSDLCNEDVAFVRLDRSLTVRPVSMRLSGGPEPDEVFLSVGWGVNARGEDPTQRMQRRVGTLDIGPTDRGFGLGDSEFETTEAVCFGDSGGPVLSAAGALVGVHSRGTNPAREDDPNNIAADCIGSRVRNIYTHLAHKRALVARAFTAAGFDPVQERPTRDAVEGRDAGGAEDASAPLDAGSSTPDAGSSTPDAGSSTLDAGSSTADASPPEASRPHARKECDDDDCEESSRNHTLTVNGCSTSPRGQSSAFVAALTFALAALVRRRVSSKT
jgi:MYXO-CTERM domain-containing protein